jgi:hypothetical protein
MVSYKMELKIAVILVWNDAQSFQQHVAAMKLFRQSHQDNLRSEPKKVKDASRPGNIHLPDSWDGAKRFTSTRARPTLVPIWEMELPKGIQN